MSRPNLVPPGTLAPSGGDGGLASHGLMSMVLNLAVRTKLLVSFILVCMIMIMVGVGVGVLGLTRTSSTNASLQKLHRDNFASVQAIGATKAGMLQTQIDLRDLALARDAAAKATVQAKVKVKVNDADLTAALAGYLASNPSDTAVYTELAKDVATYQELRQPALTLAASFSNDSSASGRTSSAGWPNTTAASSTCSTSTTSCPARDGPARPGCRPATTPGGARMSRRA